MLLDKTPDELEARLRTLSLDIALDEVVLYDTKAYMEQRLACLRDLLGRRGLQREQESRNLTCTGTIRRNLPWSWSGVA